MPFFALESRKTKNRLDADDRLILVRVKVERAKKQLRDLESEITSLGKVAVLIPDPKTGISPHPISALHPSNLTQIPAMSFDVVSIAGDIVHNLRSALDHLAQQLTLVGLRDRPPKVPLTERQLRNIGFPIAETKTKYKAERARKVERMLPAAKKAIDRLKPYKRGNPALWRIHELDNIDKHRSLFTVGTGIMFVADWLDGSYLLKAENPHFTGVEPKIEQDLQIEFQKAISKTKVARTNALLPSLHQLVDFVENIVLDFKPLLE